MLVMSVRNTLHSLWRNGEGSALIEGAIVVPLLLIVVRVVFEFSGMLDQLHVHADGIQDTARYIAQSADASGLTIQQPAKKRSTTSATDGNTALVRGWTEQDVNIRSSALENPGDV